MSGKIAVSSIQKYGFLDLFETIFCAYNSPADTHALLQIICTSLVKHLSIKATQLLIFSREHLSFEHLASSGLKSVDLNKETYRLNDELLSKLHQDDTDIDELTQDLKQIYRSKSREKELHLIATFPLKRGIQVVGVFFLFSDNTNSLTKDEIRTMNVVSHFTTRVIINSIFNSTLKKVTDTVHSSLDIETVLGNVVTVVTESLRVKGSTIRLLDKNQNIFQLKAACGLSENYLNKGPVLAEKSISQVLNGECVAIYDASKDERLQYPEEAIKEGIGSILSVPLIVTKNIIGDLRVYTHKPFEFSENEINLMMAVGEQCALAIRDAQMYSGMKDKYDELISDFHQWFDK